MEYDPVINRPFLILPTIKSHHLLWRQHNERKEHARLAMQWTIPEYNRYLQMFHRVVAKFRQFSPKVDIQAMEAAVRAREVFPDYDDYVRRSTDGFEGMEEELDGEEIKERFYHYDDDEQMFHIKFTFGEWEAAATTEGLSQLCLAMMERSNLIRTLESIPGGRGLWGQVGGFGPHLTPEEIAETEDRYHASIQELAYEISQEHPERSELENWFKAESSLVSVRDMM